MSCDNALIGTRGNLFRNSERMSRQRILCLGKFDGMHRGHLALLRRAAQYGAPTILRMTGMATVLGWIPRPPLVSEADRPRILSQWSAQLGHPIDVLRWPFAQLRHLHAQQFCQILAQDMHADVVVVGSDFRFGKDRQAGIEELCEEGRSVGIQVAVVPPELDEQVMISSTRIRSALAIGAVDEARRLYGRPHALCGRVVAGDGRGRTLGFPTANMGDVSNLVPAQGVYAAHAYLADGSRIKAAVNVGTAPTVATARESRVEAHLLDWSGDCYNQALRLDFIERIREERRFADRDDLMRQIEHDVQRVAIACDQRLEGES